MMKLPHLKRSLSEDDAGLAGVEFAFVSVILLYALLNGLEIARWYFQNTQVANAVHTASQAAWKACDTKHLPATVNCSGLNTAISNSLQATSLGTSVKLKTGYPTEAYYCVNSSGVLTQVSTVSSKPADCSGVGDSTHTPGDYLVIQASYTFSPMFAGLTAGALMPTTMSSVDYIRLQ